MIFWGENCFHWSRIHWPDESSEKYSNKTAGAELAMQLIELKNGYLAKNKRRKMKVFFRIYKMIAA